VGQAVALVEPEDDVCVADVDCEEQAPSAGTEREAPGQKLAEGLRGADDGGLVRHGKWPAR
jgi:hypothetical protein